MRRAVILDVDTGIDDAMAIVLAVRHPDLDVRAISCVAGNVSVDRVLANTLAVLDVAGSPPLPVAAGATRPIVELPRDASWVHGPDGLAGLGLPASARAPERVHAVEMLRRELVASAEPVTIVALAPLTNIALLLRTHPEVAERIERIVFMGGAASTGNATAVAEFNVWHDPEAAFVVVNSGVPLTMYGLDVFERVAVAAEDVAALATADGAVSRLVGALLGFEAIDPVEGTPIVHALIGDAGAVCALLAPHLFTIETHPVQIELAPGLSRGQTLVDRRARAGEDAVHHGGAPRWPRADVVLDADVAAVLSLMFATIAD